ncbi:scavenger receptor class F member 2-like [Lacerta agilis]|uniref:scavenger receptor class F member 2-like n=1 Tax=Lacerta agilis TaxID=80427 RepID=UPI00141957A0|nr:scavenger receptor class F member 2-like [Lacerta agilis]
MVRLRSGGGERDSGSYRPRAGATARTELRQPTPARPGSQPASQPGRQRRRRWRRRWLHKAGGQRRRPVALARPRPKGAALAPRSRFSRPAAAAAAPAPSPKAPPLRRRLLGCLPSGDASRERAPALRPEARGSTCARARHLLHLALPGAEEEGSEQRRRCLAPPRKADEALLRAVWRPLLPARALEAPGVKRTGQSASVTPKTLLRRGRWTVTSECWCPRTKPNLDGGPSCMTRHAEMHV